MINKIVDCVMRKVKENHTDSLSKLIKKIKAYNFCEVGVYKGENMFTLADKFPMCKFVGIDPYDVKVYDDYFKTERTEQESQEELDRIAKNVFLNSRENTFIFCATSKGGSIMFPDNNFDIVFIDAKHDEKSVKEDIKLWLPKVKKSGFLCGHDYTIKYFGVIKAVDSVLGTDNVRIMPGNVWVYKK